MASHSLSLKNAEGKKRRKYSSKSIVEFHANQTVSIKINESLLQHGQVKRCWDHTLN